MTDVNALLLEHRRRNLAAIVAARFLAPLPSIVLGALAGFPNPSPAQPGTRLFRIGWLGVSDISTSPQVAVFRDAFRDELRKSGWQEGQHYVLEYRYGGRQVERFPQLAAELASSKVDVILTITEPAARAAIQATNAIPVVFTGVDALAAGLVSDLARPMNNATGISSPVFADLHGKRLQLLLRAFPKIRRIAYLAGDRAEDQRRLHQVAEQYSLTWLRLEPRGPEDIERTVLEAKDVDAWYVGSQSLYYENRQLITATIARTGKPAMYSVSLFAELGGLMSYGGDFAREMRLAAHYVDKILRGTPPNQLPVEQGPLALTINRKTARAQGLIIEKSVLLSADVVID